MITYDAICKGVASAMQGVPGVVRVEAYDELSEGIPETPMLQVYVEEGETDVQAENDRTSFGAVIRQAQTIIHVDGYARPRSHLAQDMAAQLGLIDGIDGVLCNQVNEPFFGVQGIKAFRWRWERVTFEYATQQYAGCRFVIDIFTY